MHLHHQIADPKWHMRQSDRKLTDNRFAREDWVTGKYYAKPLRYTLYDVV